MYGVNSIGDLWTRYGITASRPTGSGWKKIPNVKFVHVSVGTGKIFALDKGGAIFYIGGLFWFYSTRKLNMFNELNWEIPCMHACMYLEFSSG